MRTIPSIAWASALFLAAGVLVAQPPGAGPGAGPPSGKSFLERHDVDGDGVVTAAEFASTHPMFAELDTNGDGQVTSDEVAVHQAEVKSFAASVVARWADGDDDGTTTAAEWKAALDAVDPDSDGSIEIRDLAELAPRRHFGGRHRGPGPGAFLLGALDDDRDGQVERSQLETLFAALDSSSDGTLQEDEFPEPPFPGPHGRSGAGPRWGR